jgi:hypothetical protein
MTPYIVITIAAAGMLGVALPLVLYWERQGRDR